VESGFSPGSLVRARGRDWIVLPGREPGLLRLRPLTRGTAGEIGIFLPLEGNRVASAEFEWPSAEKPGDATGVMTLFNAARLNLRSGAAPFRSLGRISVVPRPYQFVPLIMALRLDPVRLLIADDVGVGKTIEAGMIARELLDRGIAKRMAVLTPAHLCDQWERELREKFAIESVIVQPSQIARLDREKPRQDVSIYAHYPHLVASIDFVKSDRGPHRNAFLRDAADLVIVDEAHIAARPRGAGGRSEHERYELLQALAADSSRHIILVTATPHSGIEENFRSLLGLLDPSFETQTEMKQLLPHVVQRRRVDVEQWLGNDTPFPKRLSEEERYDLGSEYLKLFDDVLDYCRETVEAGMQLKAPQQRVRHWAAIAILRCLLSSPDAAAAVLNTRVDRMSEGATNIGSVDEVDRSFRPQVLDALGDEETSDHAPTAPLEGTGAAWSDWEQRRLLRYRDRARGLGGPKADRKLNKLIEVLTGILNDGRRPIVFCRFIQTANYLEKWLSATLKKKADVRAVTGEIDDEQRRERVAELTQSDPRVLVATDCLSEGVNLQDHFDTVIHYDLPWNPNRLEQREGRVDRFGQPREEVKTILLYGGNNPVDQVVLEVLIRKARKIRRDLGIAVPVPMEAEQVLQTVVDNVLLRRRDQAIQLELALSTPDASRLHEAWDAAAEREKRQRGFFTQLGIQPAEVAREVAATDAVLGDRDAVRRFLADALQRFGGSLEPSKNRDGVFNLSAGGLKPKLQDFAGRGEFPIDVTFDRQKDQYALYLGRTQPLVARVCDAVLGQAFALGTDDRFARAGAMFTDAVSRWTGLALLRFRYRLREATEEFAEEIVLAAFERGEGGPRWLEPLDTAGRNLADAAQPKANISREERVGHVERAFRIFRSHPDWFRPVLDWRVAELDAAHRRLRALLKERHLTIQPHLPPDIIGCFILVPVKGQV
jgi:superfamily II DNA or RNA helicase